MRYFVSLAALTTACATSPISTPSDVSFTDEQVRQLNQGVPHFADAVFTAHGAEAIDEEFAGSLTLSVGAQQTTMFLVADDASYRRLSAEIEVDTAVLEPLAANGLTLRLSRSELGTATGAAVPVWDDGPRATATVERVELTARADGLFRLELGSTEGYVIRGRGRLVGGCEQVVDTVARRVLDLNEVPECRRVLGSL